MKKRSKELSQWAKLLIAVLVVTAGWGFYELTTLLATGTLINFGITDQAQQFAVIAFGLLALALLVGYAVGVRKDTIIKNFVG
jgi:hypothetical protein